jgi:LuxR family quorum-sensing system transcriptional regulator CciR
MPTMDAAHALEQEVRHVEDEAGLATLLEEVCKRLGCAWFALSHHVDFLAAPERGIRIHNYPEDWALWFDRRRLGVSDPVHRASQRTTAGFLWHDMTRYDPPREGDSEILEEARRHGIGDGLTIPAHIPGETHGSISFAWEPGRTPNAEALPFARSIGGPLFEAARLLANPGLAYPIARLTDRQRECLIWAAKGTPVWAIAKIVGLSPDTVKEHLKNARARYDVSGGTLLAVRALYDGDISFADIARR